VEKDGFPALCLATLYGTQFIANSWSIQIVSLFWEES